MFGRLRLYAFGTVALIIAAAMLLDFGAKQSWRAIDATVLSIAVQCEMEASEVGIMSRTTSKAVIGCDQVQLFKTTYPDKKWRVNRMYMGLLRIGSEGPIAGLLLHETNGREPATGDVVAVVQNPADPSEIAHASRRGLSNLLLGGGVGAFGILLIASPHIGRRQKRPPQGAPFADMEVSSPRPTPTTRETAPPAQNGRRTFGRRNSI